MVKMNGCAAIDFRPSVSLFGRQGGGCRRFPFGKWRLLTWETENSKHSKCSYTCENRRGTTGISLQNSKQIRCVPTPELAIPASNARRYPLLITCQLRNALGKQCSCLYTRAILLGNCPKPLNDFREIGCAPLVLILIALGFISVFQCSFNHSKVFDTKLFFCHLNRG